MTDKKKVKIGFLIALKQEMSTLTGAHEIPQNNAPFSLSNRVWVKKTGIGAENAAKAVKELIADDFSLIISWGTATALRDDLATGTLCVPKTIITKSNKKLSTNQALLQMLQKETGKKIPLVTSSLAEAPEVLATSEEKQALYTKSRASAADMESGAIAKIAARNRVDFLAVRAISDASTTRIPRSVIRLSGSGELQIASLLKQLAVTPADWLPILQLALGFRRAKKTLTATAGRLLPILEARASSNGI